MRLPVLALLALLVASTFACGAIPPYSSVRKQEVTGLNAVKLRAAIWNSIDVKEEDTTFPFAPDRNFDLDGFSSLGIEFERLLGKGFTASFAYDTRDMEVEGAGSPINGEQIAVGLRRYFGDRALTASSRPSSSITRASTSRASSASICASPTTSSGSAPAAASTSHSLRTSRSKSP